MIWQYQTISASSTVLEYHS